LIQDFRPSDRPRSELIAKEALAHLAWGLLYPFGIKASTLRTPRKLEQRTTVLVHGYISNRSSFYPMLAYLKLRGLKNILQFNYPHDSSIEAAAVGLRQFIKHHARGGRIDLVCHSLGGVIAEVYLNQLGGSRRVDRCISIGTPYRGTYNSYWVPTKVADELRPDSNLMQRVSKFISQHSPVRHTSIVGGSDNIVIPRIFATRQGEVVHIPDTGHVGLIFSPRVFREVFNRLRSKD
jgi:pimeloyl-ACP methyl ester carboxylesterase